MDATLTHRHYIVKAVHALDNSDIFGLEIFV